MGIKVIVVDMNTMMSSDTCKKVSGICLQEISLLTDRTVQSAFMLACLSAHTEVQYVSLSHYDCSSSWQIIFTVVNLKP